MRMAAKKKSADTDLADATPELPMEPVEAEPEHDAPDPSLGVALEPKALPSLDQCKPVTHEEAMRELREANKARAISGESLAPPTSQEQAILRAQRVQTVINELQAAKMAIATGKDAVPHIERAIGLVRQ